MTEFILNYWIEVIFGLIVSGLGFACRRYWRLWKNEQQHQKTEEQKAFYDGLLAKIDERNEILEGKIDNVVKRVNLMDSEQKALKEGLLSVQGAGFKRQCKILLESDHRITEAEWLQLNMDYEAYEKLGGNGAGHELYDAVTHKYYNIE